MLEHEIFEKAIEKAKKDGFAFSKDIPLVLRENYPMDFVVAIANKSYYIVIFSHSFTKAFWGEELVCDFCGKALKLCEQKLYCGVGSQGIECWDFHIQKMVRDKEPLKYLERFL